ncbi:hypothetical protein CB0101_05415 [Synechococcus sp. CB0101]|uniref:hypothetical protein n=1 Tax=Synechococcus sp. CB0101 TaxID=232348 RepID=UPI0010A99C8B|nr:hypothetical protein [Synechococcus sp. CB0101]QCH14439.1 hypothetical protein CB0101_05415 [Synechococcus sp. CB0101]
MKHFRHPILLIALANAGLWSLPWLLDQSQLILARWREVPQFVGGTAEQDVAMRLMQLGALSERSINPGSEPLSTLPQSSLSNLNPIRQDEGSLGMLTLELEPVNNPPTPSASHRSSQAQPERPASHELPRTSLTEPASLMHRLRNADGLGGEITLASLKEPAMPVAARAERMQQQRSGDPLAALPLHWRTAMRDQLKPSRPVSRVAVVRVPAPGLRERQEIPIVVDDQGQGEAYAAPRNPKVQAVLEQWAAKQTPAEPGTVQILLVAAEPLPSEGE